MSKLLPWLALLAATVACAAAAPAAAATTPQIDAGDNAVCIADGTITCHGLDAASVADVQDFTQVAVGGAHACGLRATGEVRCFPHDGPAAAHPPAGTFTTVGAGWTASCALDPAGAPACWGEDSGSGETGAPSGGPPLHGLSVGEFHSCALDPAGEAVCWGENSMGQRTPEPGPFTAVSAGGGHTCGLRPAGAVDCWGLDNGGQAQDRTAPDGERFTAVSAGSWSTCALTDAGRVVCWGSNHQGEADPPAGTYTAVSVGRGYACALRASGALACWGDAPVPPAPAHEYAAAFHAPVAGPPEVNVARAGRVIPVKLELFDRGEEVRSGTVTVAVGGVTAELRWDAAADRWAGHLDTSGLAAKASERASIQVDGEEAGFFLLTVRR